MNRELKFKAWDERLKEFVNSENMNSGIELNYDSGYLEKLNYYELLQYSGETDKEKTEIYELDICEFYKNKEEPLFFHGIAMMNNNVVGGEWKIIRCDNVDEELPHIKGVDCLDSTSFWNDNFKKIGSAYENPELLKL